jgi:hypothetical protein
VKKGHQQNWDDPSLFFPKRPWWQHWIRAIVFLSAGATAISMAVSLIPREHAPPFDPQPAAAPTEIPSLPFVAVPVPVPATAGGETSAGGSKPTWGGAVPAPGGSAPLVTAYLPWAQAMARRMDIPAVALQAYAHAQAVMAQTLPSCHLSWPILAGIGRVESYHGRFRGAALLADGTSRPPIVGVPLDGAPGLMTISDTDNGAYDGDPVYDRAVGPMQFIPSTWRRHAADGNGDGQDDPFNINDAALAAANYLCADGRDLSTSAGWAAAVYSYNHTTEYVRMVYGWADQYSRASLA